MCSLMIDQHYTILGINTIFQAVEYNKSLVLKDLKASYTWQGGPVYGEYFEGYQLQGLKLIPIQSYKSNGRQGKCVEHRIEVKTSTLRPCECEVTIIDTSYW